MLFAFGEESTHFYVAEGNHSHWNVQDTDLTLRSHLERRNALRAISMGQNGAWFISGMPRAGQNSRAYELSAATSVKYPEIARIKRSSESIEWIAFGPRRKYILKTSSRVYSHSRTIRELFGPGSIHSLRAASFGYGGSWVAITEDGLVKSKRINGSIEVALNAKEVRRVALSPVSSKMYFIEYVDGGIAFSLTENMESALRKVQVASTAQPSPLPSSPLQASSNFALAPASQPVSLGQATPIGDSTPTGHLLTPVFPSEFRSIEFLFAASWKHTESSRPAVRHAYAIKLSNSALEARHKDYAARIGNVQKQWHGTIRECNLGDDQNNLTPCASEQCSLCRILESSYQKEFARSSGMYGTGIYSSTTSSKAAGYARGQPSSPFQAMILNDVAMGNVLYTNEAQNGLISPPDGYNSVCGLPGTSLKFDETCVYDNDAILPTYLVLYDASNSQ